MSANIRMTNNLRIMWLNIFGIDSFPNSKYWEDKTDTIADDRSPSPINLRKGFVILNASKNAAPISNVPKM
jgi:hypothetical protein